MEPDLALYEKNTCTLHVEDGQNINTNNEIIINININIIIIIIINCWRGDKEKQCMERWEGSKASHYYYHHHFLSSLFLLL